MHLQVWSLLPTAKPLSAEQWGQIKDLCAAHQAVTINGRRLRMLQYATLYPGKNDPQFTLFLRDEHEGKVLAINYVDLPRIHWEQDNVNPTNIKIKELVAMALESPSQNGRIAALLEEMERGDYKYDALWKTLDTGFQTILICRMLSEALETNKRDLANELYAKLLRDKTLPLCLYRSYDFCHAILSLVKAGLIAEGLQLENQYCGSIVLKIQPYPYEAFARAIFETGPRYLFALLRDGVISQEEVDKIMSLRSDPKVQQLIATLQIDINRFD